MKNFTVLVSLLRMIVLSSCSKPASLDRSVLDDPARSSEGKEQDAPFPIIPNPDLSLYQTYRLESSWVKFIRGTIPVMKAFVKGFRPGKMEGDKSIVPADFLINEDGTIYTAFYGHHIGDHLPIEKINQFLNGSS